MYYLYIPLAYVPDESPNDDQNDEKPGLARSAHPFNDLAVRAEPVPFRFDGILTVFVVIVYTVPEDEPAD